MALTSKQRHIKKEMKLKKRKTNLGNKIRSQPSRPKIFESILNNDIWECGLGVGCLALETQNSDLIVLNFKIDVFCLGVRDIYIARTSVIEHNNWKHDCSDDTSYFMQVDPGYLKALIIGSVKYADQFGFKPRGDYDRAMKYFNDIKFPDVMPKFEFGNNGKPHFIAGYNDSQGMIKLTMNKLQNAVGEGNYNFTVPIDENYGADKWPYAHPMQIFIMEEHLLPYFMNLGSEELLVTIYDQFISLDLVSFSEDEHEEIFNTVFLYWLFFDHRVEGKTMSDSYMEANPELLNDYQMEFITKANAVHFSFYSVINITPEKCFIIKDLFLDKTYTIQEYDYSLEINVGDILFTKVIEIEQQYILFGTGTYFFESGVNNLLTKIRKDLTKKAEAPLDHLMLRNTFADDLRILYLLLVRDCPDDYGIAEQGCETVNDDVLVV